MLRSKFRCLRRILLLVSFCLLYICPNTFAYPSTPSVLKCACNGTQYCRHTNMRFPYSVYPICYFRDYPTQGSPLSQALFPSPVLYNLRNYCGLRLMKSALKIVGGRQTIPYSWPWVAGLYEVILEKSDVKAGISLENIKQRLLRQCAATVITNRYVITAAHCILHFNTTSITTIPAHKWVDPYSYFKTFFVLQFGDHELTMNSGQIDQDKWQRSRFVDKVLFYAEGFEIYSYDIAILKLKEPIEFSPVIQPACIPPPNIELSPGTRCYSVGWGQVDRFRPGLSVFLKEVELPLVAMSYCRRHSDLVEAGQHVCAGDFSKSPWFGDSGGGLYCKLHPDDEQWYLYGVASMTTTISGPLAFTFVPGLTTWIHRNIDE